MSRARLGLIRQYSAVWERGLSVRPLPFPSCLGGFDVAGEPRQLVSRGEAEMRR